LSPQARVDVAFYVPWMGPLLTSAATTATGGAETQTFLLARELARQGVAVRVLVFDLTGVQVPSSVDDIAVSVRPSYLSHERLGKLRETFATARAVANAGATTVVTRTAGWHVGLVGLFAKLTGQRFVFSSASVSDFGFEPAPKRRDRALFRLGIHLADVVVVQTEEQVRLCRQRFGRSPVQINSIAEAAPQRERDPEAFLWIGRWVSYKRPLAFVELARALPDVRFKMIGVPVANPGGGRKLVTEIERKAAEVPNLELLPQRPRRELMDIVDRAVAIVGTADFEGMPNVFLEGWARGVPALALRHDPDGVIERHHLGGFAHGSGDRLVELARRLWEERNHQAAVAARCRRYILEYHSPGVVARRWQDVLRLSSNSRTIGSANAVQ
jgi:glycosyltransferase involved in cell wall biosynthesis